MNGSLRDVLDQIIADFQGNFYSYGHFTLPVQVKLTENLIRSFDLSYEEIRDYKSYAQEKSKEDRDKILLLRAYDTLMEAPYDQIKSLEMDKETEALYHSIDQVQNELNNLKYGELVRLSREQGQAALEALKGKIQDLVNLCSQSQPIN